MYKIDFEKPIHIHFIGIGGISMSGLAEILLEEGFTVSGSDTKESPLTKKLAREGARIAYGQKADNITPDIDCVVYTAAINKANPELKENYAVRLTVPNRFVSEDLLSGSKEKDLLDYLRAGLKNTSIHFIIQVDENMEPSRAIYTPLEKFQEMQKNNPEIANFRKDLDLDLEL